MTGAVGIETRRSPKLGSLSQTYAGRFVTCREFWRGNEADNSVGRRSRFCRCWSLICWQRWRIAHNSRSLLQNVSLIIRCGSARAFNLHRTITKPYSAVTPAAVRINRVRIIAYVSVSCSSALFALPKLMTDNQSRRLHFCSAVTTGRKLPFFAFAEMCEASWARLPEPNLWQRGCHELTSERGLVAFDDQIKIPPILAEI
jgi:hypothetical protein